MPKKKLLGDGLVQQLRKLLSEGEGLRQKVFGKPDKNDPVVKILKRLEGAYDKSLFGEIDKSASEVGGAIAKRLGVNPAIGAALLGMVVPGPGEGKALGALGSVDDVAKAVRSGSRTYKAGDAIEEGLTVTGRGGGSAGRPNASASSPALRELREGVRKSTGLQNIKDRLNQTRPSGGGPGKNPVPKQGQATRQPLTPEQRKELIEARKAAPRERQVGNSPATNPRQQGRAENYGLDDRVDRAIGNRIPTPKKGGQNRIKPQATDTGTKGTPEVGAVSSNRLPGANRQGARPPADRTQTPYQGTRPGDSARIRQQKGQLPKGSGEIPGVSTVGPKPEAGRSLKETQRARALLKQLLEKAKKQNRPAAVKRIEQQLKRLK